MRWVMLMALWVGAACTDAGNDDGPSFCGDGVCNIGESAGNCPGDCAAGGACSPSNDTCGGETICVGNSCVAAFPRVYAITNVSVMLPTTDPNGEAWDLGGGAPDLFVGDSSGNPLTNTVQDQFSATFPGPFDVQLIAGATLRISIWDEDVSANDLAFSCQAAPVTADLLRSRVLRCTQGGSTLAAALNPK